MVPSRTETVLKSGSRGHLKSQLMHRGIWPERGYTVRVSRESWCESGSVAIHFTGVVRAGIRTRRNA
jgi:hypothetical protein